MAIRNIIKHGDETLEKRSREITDFDSRLHMLLDDMKETMENVSGAGLAAVQVGILRRAVIVDIDDTYLELINPVIKRTSGEQECYEGCLSVPGVFGYTLRPEKIAVEAFDRNGKKILIKAETQGLVKAVCHELDHLDGVLFLDKVIRFEEDEL